MELFRLRELRKGRRLTQREAAALFSVSKSSYANWEDGKYQPDIGTLITMSEYFGVSLDYLLGKPDKGFTPDEAQAIRKAMAIIEKKL